MGTGRGHVAVTVRFLFVGAVVSALVAPQAMTFLSAREDAVHGSESISPLESRRFAIKGKVKRLYPGAKKTLKLRVRNRSAYRIRLETLTVKVKKPNKAGCKMRWLKLKKQMSPRLKLLPKKRAVIPVRVKLSKKATDSCQGARWPLEYRGSAVGK